MKPKGVVYIDGYNWYHGIFKHYPEWKWINIESFFTSLRPDEEIVSVKMFSSWIVHDEEALARQKRYFNALATLSKVKLIFGLFQPREVTCRGSCREKYTVQDEKKTDVNLAVEMRIAPKVLLPGSGWKTGQDDTLRQKWLLPSSNG